MTTRNKIINQVYNQVWNQVFSQVYDQVNNQVRIQVENQVYNQVRTQVWNQVRNQVENQVWNQVENQVRNQVWNQVENQVGNQVKNQVYKFINPYLFGSFDSSYFSFYDYMSSLNIEIDNKINYYKAMTELGCVYSFPNWCVVSQKPIKINMKAELLHNELEPSIVYDGINPIEIYSIEGNIISKDDHNIIKELIISQSKKLALLNIKNSNQSIANIAKKILCITST